MHEQLLFNRLLELYPRFSEKARGNELGHQSIADRARAPPAARPCAHERARVRVRARSDRSGRMIRRGRGAGKLAPKTSCHRAKLDGQFSLLVRAREYTSRSASVPRLDGVQGGTWFRLLAGYDPDRLASGMMLSKQPLPCRCRRHGGRAVPHSWRRAVIGSMRAARRAGQMPERIPTAHDMPKDTSM